MNASNKAGSTALHFAALQGNVYMVELLLSHSKINVVRDWTYVAIDMPPWDNFSCVLRS